MDLGTASEASDTTSAYSEAAGSIVAGSGRCAVDGGFSDGGNRSSSGGSLDEGKQRLISAGHLHT